MVSEPCYSWKCDCQSLLKQILATLQSSKRQYSYSWDDQSLLEINPCDFTKFKKTYPYNWDEIMTDDLVCLDTAYFTETEKLLLKVM